MRGFKLQITLVVVFKEEVNNDEAKYVRNHFNAYTELIIRDLNIDETIELTYQLIISRIQKLLGEVLVG